MPAKCNVIHNDTNKVHDETHTEEVEHVSVFWTVASSSFKSLSLAGLICVLLIIGVFW